MADPGQALRAAASSADTEQVRHLLVDHRDFINAPDERFGNTALHWAVTGGYIEIVAVLLSAGADPNQRNRDGVTALWLARDFGLDEIANELSRYNARE